MSKETKPKGKGGLSIQMKLYGVIALIAVFTMIMGVGTLISVNNLKSTTESLAVGQVNDLIHVSDIIAKSGVRPEVLL